MKWRRRRRTGGGEVNNRTNNQTEMEEGGERKKIGKFVEMLNKYMLNQIFFIILVN